MQGSAPVLLQGLLPPPAACVQRAKCPPLSRNKESPPTSENGGAKKGARATLSLKREFEFKNIIIIIIII